MTYETLEEQEKNEATPQETVPQDIKDLAADLDEASSKDVALRKAYDVLTEKFKGGRLTWLYMPWRIFSKDLFTMWNKRTTLVCTEANTLLAAVLTQTKWFSHDDIETKWSVVWIAPHQYTRVKCDDHWVNVDIWGASRGVPYDSHARGFR